MNAETASIIIELNGPKRSQEPTRMLGFVLVRKVTPAVHISSNYSHSFNILSSRGKQDKNRGDFIQ